MCAHILATAAWPYANGPRHIGHVSGFGVPSDVFARYMRSNRIEQSHESITQCLDHPSDLVGLRVERPATYDEDSVRPEQLCFLGRGLRDRSANADSLHGRQRDK